MSQATESVWLGPARKPIRMLMIISIGLLAAISIYIVAAAVFFDASIGLRGILRPLEYPEVMAFYVAGLATLLLTGIHFSDTRGAIETEPDGFFDIVSLVCSRIAMVMIAAVVVVMFFEVVARYIFVKPTLWANELSLWIAGFVFLLAGLYAMQQRSHIRIYVIYDMMPRWLQKSADVLSVLLLWSFTVATIWGGFNEARDKLLRMETFGTAWDPPIPATIKAMILLTVVLVSIQALSNLIADWNKAPESHSPMDEIDEVEIEQIRRTLKDQA